MQEKIEDIIDQFSMINQIKEELSVVDNSLSKDITALVDRTLDSFKHNLAELLENENQTELIKNLNRKISI